MFNARPLAPAVCVSRLIPHMMEIPAGNQRLFSLTTVLLLGIFSPSLTPPHQGSTTLTSRFNFSIYHFVGTVCVFTTLTVLVAFVSSSITFTLASTAPAQLYSICSIPLALDTGGP